MKRKILICMLAILLTTCGKTAHNTDDWVAEGSFTDGVEGPAIDAAGNLYAVNLERQGTIGIVTARGEAEIFLELPDGGTGNSIRFDRQGFMYVADYSGHNILKIDPRSGRLMQKFHNKQMHQPNDIAIHADGTIYASDPDWKNGTGQLWKMNAAGNFTLLEGDMGTTNGIELSPDNRRLYVNESVQRKVWVYDVKAGDGVANKRLLIEFPDHGLDGMATDRDGNLYIARYGAGVVVVVSPQGRLLREIRLRGRYPTNIVLARDGGRAFVTMQERGNIESFPLNSLQSQ